MLSNDCSIKLTFHCFYIVFDYSWFLEQQINWYTLLLFLQLFIHQVLFFELLVFIFESLIVDLFFSIDWIIVNWYWNLSSGVLENWLWDISKPDIRIWSPHRYVEGRGKDIGWIFRTTPLRFIALLDIKSPSSFSFNPSFVDFWLVCIICIGSAFIDPETCPRVC